VGKNKRDGHLIVSLECHECGARLAGIIEPYDDELLLSELEGFFAEKSG
jgi:hypothetical protein